MNIKGNQIPGQSGMGCTRYNIHTYLYVYILLRSTYYYYLRIRIRLKVSNTYLYMEQYILGQQVLLLVWLGPRPVSTASTTTVVLAVLLYWLRGLPRCQYFDYSRRSYNDAS